MQARIENIPVLSALYKVLLNDSVVYAVVSTISAMYLYTHDYDNIITAAVLFFGAVLIGASEWRDIRSSVLIPFRHEVEEGVGLLLSQAVELPLPNGKMIRLDIPNELEAPIKTRIISAIYGEVNKLPETSEK